MSPEISRVLACIAGDDTGALASALCECKDPNERLRDGESALFHAVLSGKPEHVRILLERGADPNFRASEPADDALAPTPLDLAMQARFLMDWDVYHPIALLLQSHGARNRDGVLVSPEQLEVMEARARDLQADRIASRGGPKLARSLLRLVRSLLGGRVR